MHVAIHAWYVAKTRFVTLSAKVLSSLEKLLQRRAFRGVVPILVPRPCGRENWPGIHCLWMRDWFQKASANESDYVQSYTWLLCGEITKLDIRLAVCLRGEGFHYQRHKGWHDKDYATTTASSTVTVLVVENKRQSRSRWTSQILWVACSNMSLPCGYVWFHPAALLSAWNLSFQYNREQTWALDQSPHFYLPCLWHKLEMDVLQSYTIKTRAHKNGWLE